MIGMVIRREKKVRKKRGHRTYGYGTHKRGGGSRGGRGQAGMHKHKWSYTVKYDPEHFGKHGFSRTFAGRKVKAINLKELDAIAKKSGKSEVDLTEMGYGKLLGTGRITKAVTVKVGSFSKGAAKKIEAAGGKITASKPEEAKQK